MGDAGPVGAADAEDSADSDAAAGVGETLGWAWRVLCLVGEPDDPDEPAPEEGEALDGLGLGWASRAMGVIPGFTCPLWPCQANPT